MNKTPFSCRYAAQEVEYSILYKNQTDVKLFPLLKSNTGSTPLYNIGPTHFRSFVFSKIDDHGFIVSEGNGLSYTEWTFLNTGDFRTIQGGRGALLIDYKQIKHFQSYRTFNSENA